jgi:phosphodiesterase/alkaline phosphatase D-like protein
VFPDAATLIFYPPDSFRCLVEVSDSNSFTNPIRVRDESAEEEDRHMIRVAGLKPDTAYFYRLLCSSATAQGDFRTLGVQ